jgi:hypothetical protein
MGNTVVHFEVVGKEPGKLPRFYDDYVRLADQRPRRGKAGN